MLTRERTRALLALVPLALVPLLVAATHGSRHLTALSCGQTITTNTTLDADLGPCGGNGVIVGADHVTLNLNGHRISGNGPGVTRGVSSNHVGVVVQNGSIVGFDFGVVLSGVSNRAMNLRVSAAGATGIEVDGANSVISGNRSFGNAGNGIAGSGVGSQYTNNVLQSNAGIGLSANNPSAVSGNKALNNSTSGINFGNGLGGSVTVTNNVANGNGHDGLTENTGDPTAVVTLSGNKAYFNTQLGIAAAPGVNDGGNNKADSNGTAVQCTNVVCS
jgi:hypothetical protein